MAPASRAATPAPQAAQAAPSPLIAMMQGEIEREMAILGKADPAAYYLGYTLTDSDRAEVVGSNGALLNSQQVAQPLARGAGARRRLRPRQHALARATAAARFAGSYGEAVPIEDDAGVLRRAMWRQTDEQYRAAAEAFVKVSTSKDVAVQTAEQRAPDFSQEKAECVLWPARIVHAGPASRGKKRRGSTRNFSTSRRPF